MLNLIFNNFVFFKPLVIYFYWLNYDIFSFENYFDSLDVEEKVKSDVIKALEARKQRDKRMSQQDFSIHKVNLISRMLMLSSVCAVIRSIAPTLPDWYRRRMSTNQSDHLN